MYIISIEEVGTYFWLVNHLGQSSLLVRGKLFESCVSVGFSVLHVFLVAEGEML